MTTGETPSRGDITPRGGNGRFVRRADTAERDADACRLRTAGATYDQIAQQLGFANREGARRAVERALAAIVAEPATELRALEVLRLDELTVEAMRILRREHVLVSDGRIIRDDHGKPIRDDGPTLAAIDRLLKIMERRSRLLGLDAPTKIAAFTDAAIAAEIVRLEAELALMDTETDDGPREIGPA